MANIITYLTALHQEVEPGHPLVGANASLSGEVMDMCDQAFHQIGKTPVITLRVDFDRVRRDVVNCQVQQSRRRYFV